MTKVVSPRNSILFCNLSPSVLLSDARRSAPVMPLAHRVFQPNGASVGGRKIPRKSFPEASSDLRGALRDGADSRKRKRPPAAVGRFPEAPRKIDTFRR